LSFLPPFCRPFSIVASAKISLAQVIVAGETKLFARAGVSEFAHRCRVRRSIRGKCMPAVGGTRENQTSLPVFALYSLAQIHLSTVRENEDATAQAALAASGPAAGLDRSTASSAGAGRVAARVAMLLRSRHFLTEPKGRLTFDQTLAA
jgi:hypothetical protein